MQPNILIAWRKSVLLSLVYRQRTFCSISTFSYIITMLMNFAINICQTYWPAVWSSFYMSAHVCQNQWFRFQTSQYANLENTTDVVRQCSLARICMFLPTSCLQHWIYGVGRGLWNVWRLECPTVGLVLVYSSHSEKSPQMQSLKILQIFGDDYCSDKWMMHTANNFSHRNQ